MTPVQLIYDRFFDLITDDMYMEISEEQTKRDCRSLLMASIPTFEFPKHPFTFTTVEELGEKVLYIEQDLTLEEITILAYGMVVIWTQRQVTSIENTRQKFSGADFKLSSQASQLQRLMRLLLETKDEHRRLQMLHSRRRVNPKGEYESTFDMFVNEMYPKTAVRRGVSMRPTTEQQTT